MRHFILWKKSAQISVKANVKKVENYIKLTDEEITQILSKNQDKLIYLINKKNAGIKNAFVLLNLKM